ncbi:unnamed protein product [Oreochromis niloticus]|nr:unnamed protein product [Mustela putorius furo]
MVKKQVVLKNGTDAFEAWKDPPAHIYMQFYFFNLTNPQEVLDGERPAVVEIGPYTYREYRPMEQIDFQDNGTKVTAVNSKTYIFQRDMSRGPESDLIRTVNIPAMNNASNDGEYVFFTGQQNSRDFSRVDTWKGESSLNWWTSDECNMINGTIGTSFHPVITKNDMLYIFSSDLCRSLYTVYEEDVTVKGITGYRFVPPSSVFANLTVNPDNAGFCVPAGNCLGSGLLNVSVCKEGAPIIMSSPHFYQADEKFAQDIFGMTPNKEEHQTAIDINPLTGVVLQAAKRLQINVYVEQIPNFSQTGNVRTVVFPVAYLNESATIDDTAAKKLKGIGVQQNVVENIPFMLIGLAIIVGGIFMFLVCQQKVPESTTAERQPLLSS